MPICCSLLFCHCFKFLMFFLLLCSIFLGFFLIVFSLFFNILFLIALRSLFFMPLFHCFKCLFADILICFRLAYTGQRTELSNKQNSSLLFCANQCLSSYTDWLTPILYLSTIHGILYKKTLHSIDRQLNRFYHTNSKHK